MNKLLLGFLRGIFYGIFFFGCLFTILLIQQWRQPIDVQPYGVTTVDVVVDCQGGVIADYNVREINKALTFITQHAPLAAMPKMRTIKVRRKGIRLENCMIINMPLTIKNDETISGSSNGLLIDLKTKP